MGGLVGLGQKYLLLEKYAEILLFQIQFVLESIQGVKILGQFFGKFDRFLFTLSERFRQSWAVIFI